MIYLFPPWCFFGRRQSVKSSEAEVKRIVKAGSLWREVVLLWHNLDAPATPARGEADDGCLRRTVFLRR